MKKRNSIRILLAAAALLVATAACTKDELTDGDRLPEGQYPLEIARITLGVEGGEAQPWGAPTIRVSENGDGTGSTFDAGDPFAVQIDGEREVGTYTVQDDGSAEAETPLYWSDRDEAHTVTAWYPATDGTLDLSNQQTNGLAYLLGATGTGDYRAPVTLSFTHRLAKVRVTPSDDALGKVQSLQLYAYTQCTYEKGKVVQGSQEGWIEMKPCEYNGVTCWEVNVVPNYEITKLRANGIEERTLSSAITPVAGKFYDITLNYDPGYTYDEASNTYTVDNEKGLKNLAELVNEEGKTDIDITLTGDIDLTEEWTPIGTYDNPYTGTFDGGDHTITGLTVKQEGTNHAGLFGVVGSGGTVKNVKLTNASVTGGSYVGGVAGYSYGNIENCSVNGTVTGTGYNTGGIAGLNYGTISGCNAEGTVTGGESNVGGIAGNSSLGSTIEGCYSTAAVSGSSSVGGVVGSLQNDCSLMACYSTGDVTASTTGYAGGVVGSNAQGTVTGCYHAKGTVSGQADNVGGIVGMNSNRGQTTACYWSSNPANGIGKMDSGTNGTIKVDGTTVTWTTALISMNQALQEAGSEWQYEPGDSLPTLTK